MFIFTLVYAAFVKKHGKTDTLLLFASSSRSFGTTFSVDLIFSWCLHNKITFFLAVLITRTIRGDRSPKMSLLGVSRVILRILLGYCQDIFILEFLRVEGYK